MRRLTLLVWLTIGILGATSLLLAWGVTLPPVAAQRGGNWPQISLTKLVGGLSQPVHITHASDGSGRLFIVEQSGRIRIVKNSVLLDTPFLNITGRVLCCGERGLLSVAFPPGYANKGYFYVNYTRKPDGDTVVARYRITTDPDVADPDSEETVLIVDQPYANHNGGQLAFGPDGYLYIGMGDGGSAGDPGNRAQNPGELLGKLLRIDVESGANPYAIPASNPYTRTTGYQGEIWALGLRNPWRFAFDRERGDLYIADVGQNRYEEVDYQPASSRGGENYGWRILEGSHCYNPPSGCVPPGRYVQPVAEYDHTQGCSVTGGMVYRGQIYPRMQGIYFYGDYCSGRIWGLKRGVTWQTVLLLDSPYALSTFGEDEAGNLYVADHAGGGIYRLADTVVSTPTDTPTATPSPTTNPKPTRTPTRVLIPVLIATSPVSGTVRFAVIGDYGLASQPEQDVADLVKSWNPDFVITTGDNNYPRGAAATIDQNIGQYYHEFIHPYTGDYGTDATSNRFFPSLGNHDWMTAGAAPYLDYFTLPGNERYYDFVWGPVHLFALDSDSREPDGIASTSAQAAWLRSRLALSTAPWKLVYMHHPPFSSGLHGSTVAMQWPYRQWGATAVLAGHDHTYERIVKDGFLYFVNGLGGSTRYAFGAPVPGSQVRYNADYGAMLVEASQDAIVFQFISRAGVVVDRYTVVAVTLTPTPTPIPAATSYPADGMYLCETPLPSACPVPPSQVQWS